MLFNFLFKKLEDDLEKELSGNFRKVVLGLLMKPIEYEAFCMRNAIKGFGTNQKAVINLLCTKESHEIKHLKQAYLNLYQRDLVKDLENEESGYFGRVLRSLVQAARPNDTQIDYELAKRESQDLYNAGVGKNFGTDELEFVRIFCSRSFTQLKFTFEEYFKFSGKDIEHAIKKEFSGDLKDALMAIAQCVCHDVSYYLSEQLLKCMKGIGTDDETLIRILISRFENDLDAIIYYFNKNNEKSLHDWIKGETSGDYKKILLSMVTKAQKNLQ